MFFISAMVFILSLQLLFCFFFLFDPNLILLIIFKFIHFSFIRPLNAAAKSFLAFHGPFEVGVFCLLSSPSVYVGTGLFFTLKKIFSVSGRAFHMVISGILNLSPSWMRSQLIIPVLFHWCKIFAVTFRHLDIVSKDSIVGPPHLFKKSPEWPQKSLETEQLNNK